MATLFLNNPMLLATLLILVKLETPALSASSALQNTQQGDQDGDQPEEGSKKQKEETKLRT